MTVTAALATLASAARRESPSRLVWLLLGLGLSSYAAGFVVVSYVSVGEAGGPWGHRSDTASLLLYPCAYAGLLLLTRDRVSRQERLSRGSALDGAVVLTGGAAVAIAAAARLYPSLMHGSAYHVVYALAYPVGGLTLLVATVTGLALTGWRLDRVWALLVTGFALMTFGDVVYGLRTAAGTYHFGTWLDATYTAGPVCVALAAGLRRSPARAQGDARVAMAVPSVLTLTAVAVLVAGSTQAVPTVATGLAAGCVVLAVGRTLVFLHQDAALARTRAQARSDELTGLTNRRGLLEQLRRPRQGGSPGVLLLIDLDGFKEVNDSLGHASGDQLLVLVAERLRANCPGCLVARLGGDEFAVLIPSDDPAAVAGGAAMAARLRTLLGQPALLAATHVAVGASLGYAAVPARSASVPDPALEVVRRADTALYRAKRLRTGSEAWSPSLDAPTRRLELVTELREALAAPGQLVAHYQPMVDPGDGRRVVGLEALVRWRHPRRGLLLPEEFLDQLERAGLLPALTMQMLEQALTQLSELLRAGYDLHVAVNVGAPDLLDIDLPAAVGRLLARHGLPVQSLHLEVSENVVMQEPERIVTTLRGLQELGVGLSLDDYGTGMASLGYLRHLPVHELKIDKSLVRELVTDPACALIVSSTIQLAHDLGLHAVAEGVEDQATMDTLARAGCDTVQGWHTGRPLPPEQLGEALRTLGGGAWALRQREALDLERAMTPGAVALPVHADPDSGPDRPAHTGRTGRYAGRGSPR